MIELRDKVVGPFTLSEDAVLYGMVTDRLTVLGGVRLELRGMVTGDLIVEAGATVEIRGMVNGAVLNRGGEVIIYGKVDSVSGTHRCKIMPGATIGL